MSDTPNNTPYRVLARKYRPSHFDELIGQEALVRTLKNAITSGRIAQAYMLTGVRGVGKTTTARIIAKAINYVGPDGKGGPTVGPTDDCPVCQAIAEDRHPDVIEMDAASHTGVDDIRDIIDGIRYAPASARYKVYIIDEVHMLSKQAFNALLKTLEEPPAHAKFIFATTEIRKVPMTILSRCQRFDLRRMDANDLQNYFKQICEWEKVTSEDDALAMIARAAGGSARDGLSILDQAIALGQGSVTAALVKEMLGLVDQGRVVDLLGLALGGQIPDALQKLGDLDRLGADPMVVVEDLLALTHMLIKARVSSDTAMLPSPEAVELSGKLTLPALSRAWQILLRSLQDVGAAPDPFAAAEMTIIRLGYASTLPDPGKLVRTLADDNGQIAPAPMNTQSSSRQPEPVARGGYMQQSAAVQMDAAPSVIHDIADVVAVLEHHGHMILGTQVAHYVQVTKFETGRIDFVPVDGAPPKLANDLGAALQQITGQRWIIALSHGVGQPTYTEQLKERERKIRAEVEADPAIRGILLAFPGTKIEDIQEN